MTDHVYRVTEIVGTSSDGVDAAIKTGLSRAAETIRHLDWFEVTEVRGYLEDGEVSYFQVGLKVGFRFGRSLTRTPLRHGDHQSWRFP